MAYSYGQESDFLSCWYKLIKLGRCAHHKKSQRTANSWSQFTTTKRTTSSGETSTFLLSGIKKCCSFSLCLSSELRLCLMGLRDPFELFLCLSMCRITDFASFPSIFLRVTQILQNYSSRVNFKHLNKQIPLQFS